MSEPLDDILGLFHLTDDQLAAASERQCNLAVTAGAGSGKTSTLVARYLGLLSDGLLPRQVAAITFTEKAAREMRSRARQELRGLVLQAGTPTERLRWSELENQMDSAHIGTIHSLCAEILRSHPAEAGIDPQAVVLEENQAGVLRAAAVDNALAWLTQQPESALLFRSFTISALQRLLATLLSKRLDLDPASFDPTSLAGATLQALRGFLQDGAAINLRADLRSQLAGLTPAGIAADGMAAQAVGLLAALDEVEAGLGQATGDPVPLALALFQARRGQMRLNVGRRGSPIKETVAELRERYDACLPWLGGANARDLPPDALVEAALAQASPLLGRLYAQMLTYYQASLAAQSALDFDDLEAGAGSLLSQPRIRAHWQAELSAVLVDEFQDTNARQRQIILDLAGDQPGRLFVVGDALQSIYRFRGADVTVFTGLQADLQRLGGRALHLDRTFRAHPALLDATGGLLALVMGSQPDPARPYQIPFAPLTSLRGAPRKGITPPFIECILAAGENAETGRPAAARALASRLLELKAADEIKSWEEAALLFRASTTFPVYEGALEEAGIPFVTVAGSGFYNRPEVRDLLNLLHALAEPWNDQALAGLLRSPAIGLSDPGLYTLRQPQKPLRAALQSDLGTLSPTDQGRARRALDILEELEPEVDRRSVSELLQRIVERTDYRATLASVAARPGSARLWNNVDKLIGDAQASGLVRVRPFLEYIATLRDIGAREGEAAPEAEGAVRLMTIHKAKGLQFPLVVLADAGRKPNVQHDPAIRIGEGWAFAPDRLDSLPLAYNLAAWQDVQQSSAEDLRLLYVALTRAQEKLIISGHLRLQNGGTSADGWLKILLEAGGQIPESLPQRAGLWQALPLPAGGQWAVYLAPLDAETQPTERIPVSPWPDSEDAPLFAPLAAVTEGMPSPTSPLPPRRLILEPHSPPARVVGEMVHKALQRWRFPGDPSLEGLLRAVAQAEGLLDETLIQKALSEAGVLLRRFQGHALFMEMDAALERYHELPFVQADPQGVPEWGFIDCLYRAPQGWILVDFKTDRIDGPAALEKKVAEYTPQLVAYRQAAQNLLGAAPLSRMCFLDVNRSLSVISID